jgi:lipoyl(octanoyl) transferase
LEDLVEQGRLLNISLPASQVNKPLPVFDLGLAPYCPVQELQRRLRAAVADAAIDGVLLLLEHESVITLGKRADPSDLRDPPAAASRAVTVVRSERGGQCTLHAPGQLVSYPILPIPRNDLRAYVHQLEEVVLLLLRFNGLCAGRLAGRPGVYQAGRKIASVGLRCQRGVASHGTSLNVTVDLSLFDLLTSCGDPHLQQTSMQQAAGQPFAMDSIKDTYVAAFHEVFGLPLAPTRPLTHDRVEDSLGLSPAPTRNTTVPQAIPTAGFEPATPGSGGQCSIP